jgi:hypothetical protein
LTPRVGQLRGLPDAGCKPFGQTLLRECLHDEIDEDARLGRQLRAACVIDRDRSAVGIDRRIESFGDRIDLPAFKLPVGTDIRIVFQKFR